MRSMTSSAEWCSRWSQSSCVVISFLPRLRTAGFRAQSFRNAERTIELPLDIAAAHVLACKVKKGLAGQLVEKFAISRPEFAVAGLASAARKDHDAQVPESREEGAPGSHRNLVKGEEGRIEPAAKESALKRLGICAAPGQRENCRPMPASRNALFERDLVFRRGRVTPFKSSGARRSGWVRQSFTNHRGTDRRVRH